MSNLDSINLYKKFTTYLEKKYGWFIIPSKIENTAFILGKLLIKFGETKLIDLFESEVNHDSFSDVDEELIDLYSVNETYFNREPETLAVLPELAAQAFRQNGKLNLLCAASSSGEEVYSTAIAMGDNYLNNEIMIYGIEINQKMIRIAGDAIYNDWSLRTCAAGFKEEYFNAVDKRYKLKDEYRKNISFIRYNLLSPNLYYFLADIKFDIILCRNLFLYLNASAIEAVTDNLLRVLNPGGFLITGLAEGALSEKLRSRNYKEYGNIFRF